MDIIDLKKLHGTLLQNLAVADTARVELGLVGESGLAIRIDGNRFLHSIGVWPNGCCDVEFLEVSSEKGEFVHFEFTETAEALAEVSRQISLALQRG
jgi:hypothetical protein